jgi:hypothetical protein
MMSCWRGSECRMRWRGGEPRWQGRLVRKPWWRLLLFLEVFVAESMSWDWRCRQAAKGYRSCCVSMTLAVSMGFSDRCNLHVDILRCLLNAQLELGVNGLPKVTTCTAPPATPSLCTRVHHLRPPMMQVHVPILGQILKQIVCALATTQPTAS